jgi:thioredoxin-related protein
MKPLQMKNSTTFLKGIKDNINVATPYSTKVQKDDMSKWMIMQLNMGKYCENLDKQLFTKEQ